MGNLGKTIMLLVLTGCCVCKPSPVQQKDSTVIHVVDKVVVRDSVVFVELPVESSSAVLPTILPSHLETSLAESDAFVDSLGLHHTLHNKSDSVPVHVPVTEVTHGADTTAVQTNTQTVYVEKELTWWEQARLGAFWWLVAGLTLSLVWIFGKPILAILKI